MTSAARADVVVVGSGMAGLAAAIRALEAGAGVTVIEKGNRLGGSTWLSSGLIWTFFDRDQVRAELPEGNFALQELVVDGLPEGHEWLRAQGVELGPERDFMWYGRGRTSDPRQLITAMSERVRSLGGTLLTETALREIRMGDAGSVRAIEVDTPGGTSELHAGAVVLATGGFQGNAELLERYVTPYASRLYLRANPWSVGDGLLAATRVGAAVTAHLGDFYGHTMAAPPTTFTELEFQEVGQRYGPVSVAINLEGRRFVDESAGTGEEHLNQAVARQPEATAAYVVDAESAEISYGGPSARTQIARLRAHGGPIVESDTLEGLCDALTGWSIDAETALATLRAYRAAMAADPARLYPARRTHRFALTSPPFQAVLVRPGITFTGGGLHVDTTMRVTRRAGSGSALPLVVAPGGELTLRPFPNLYAAGCDVGDISVSGYMGGLATALVTGRIAGTAAAQDGS